VLAVADDKIGRGLNAVGDGYEKFPDRFVRKKLLVHGLAILKKLSQKLSQTELKSE